MASESFTVWAKRMHRECRWNMKPLIDWIESCQDYWNNNGKPGFSVPGFRKTAGKKHRNGFKPSAMRHPADKDLPRNEARKFVFPIFEFINRDSGDLLIAEPREAKCPKCAGRMVRKNGKNGEFFSCLRFPSCRGSADAWYDYTVLTPAQVEAKGQGREANDGEGQSEVPRGGPKPSTPAESTPKPSTPEAPADQDDPFDDEGEPGPVEYLPAPEAPAPKPETSDEARQRRLIERIVQLVSMTRKAFEAAGISIDCGYRTTKHLAQIAAIIGDADQAWRWWIDGRVSENERAKLTARGLPGGAPRAFATVEGEPSWYGPAEAFLNAGLPVYLVGPAGTGKTRFAKWAAKRAGKSLHMVVGSGDVAGREMWVARRDAKKGETTMTLGPAAKAAQDGGLLFLDEMDGFDPNSLLPLNAVLNGDREVSVPVLGAIEIDPGMGCLAAGNTNGRSRDPKYKARTKQDGATLNRFAVILQTRYESSVDDSVAREAFLEALRGPAEAPKAKSKKSKRKSSKAKAKKAKAAESSEAAAKAA